MSKSKLDKSWDDYLKSRKETNKALEKLDEAMDSFTFVCQMIVWFTVALAIGIFVVWLKWHT